MKYGIVIIENRFEDSKVREHIDNHKKFLPEGWGSFYVKDEKIKTLNDYNKLLTSKEFWEAIPFDKVLITQMDAEMLRPGIEEFLEYDYIGAPLYHIDFPCMNGGFSLRDKKAMLDVIRDNPYQGESVHGYEDIYFCNELKKKNSTLPTKEVAQLFSVETIFGLGSLGIHAIEKWHSKEKCEQILKQYD